MTIDELRRRIAMAIGRIPTDAQLRDVQRALEAGVEFDRYLATVQALTADPGEIKRMTDAFDELARGAAE